jgi:hypothetical protein
MLTCEVSGQGHILQHREYCTEFLIGHDHVWRCGGKGGKDGESVYPASKQPFIGNIIGKRQPRSKLMSSEASTIPQPCSEKTLAATRLPGSPSADTTDISSRAPAGLVRCPSIRRTLGISATDGEVAINVVPPKSFSALCVALWLASLLKYN